MQFTFELEERWPPNGWLAVCDPQTTAIHVRHGARVETAGDWYCEAVWAGEFAAGGFDRTDVVFGSGGRIRDGRLTFVGSGSTVDRLQYAQLAGRTYVSNSLVCLIALLDVELDPCHAGYFAEFASITQGVEKVRRELRTVGGPTVALCYFKNLVWDGSALGRQDKPRSAGDFSSFEGYTSFLRDSVCRLAANGRDPARRHPYGTIATLSSGYDSPAVTALALAAGNTEAITFGTARGGDGDDGQEIAARLGVACRLVPRDAWQALAFPEIPFLAANAFGEEMHFAGAADLLAGRVLLTGYHGGRIWDRDSDTLGPEIVRKDPSGLALTEYRLWQGFLHCPVPFIGTREARAVHAIGNGPDMARWDVGGGYNRPICRRIVEEAGVPRELFGQHKRAASIVLRNAGERFLTDGSWEDYRSWLRQRTFEFVRRGKAPPLLMDALDRRRILGATMRMLPAGVADRVRRRVPAVDRVLNGSVSLFYYLFPWAVAHAVGRYRRQADPLPSRPAAAAGPAGGRPALSG